MFRPTSNSTPRIPGIILQLVRSWHSLHPDRPFNSYMDLCVLMARRPRQRLEVKLGYRQIETRSVLRLELRAHGAAHVPGGREVLRYRDGSVDRFVTPFNRRLYSEWVVSSGFDSGQTRSP